ncbi:hypothetical protein PVAP13_5KG597800 [Panicum virgatum]|uniref:Uncharacterized protein n=1 Tax=Panicum virgatum TaxID=38727 RepID=A0A8T0STL3_PANVG|nr:hypothetical protein PVAP13_5KG597800 [Panicum virgatum]
MPCQKIDLTNPFRTVNRKLAVPNRAPLNSSPAPPSGSLAHPWRPSLELPLPRAGPKQPQPQPRGFWSGEGSFPSTELSRCATPRDRRRRRLLALSPSTHRSGSLALVPLITHWHLAVGRRAPRLPARLSSPAPARAGS